MSSNLHVCKRDYTVGHMREMLADRRYELDELNDDLVLCSLTDSSIDLISARIKILEDEIDVIREALDAGDVL